MKTDRRVLRTRKQINRAVLALLQTQSIDTITVKAIAAKADINRKTFYNHHANVNDVVDAIQTDIVDALTLQMKRFDQESLLRDPSPLLRLSAQTLENNAAVNVFKEHPMLLGAFMEKLKRAFVTTLTTMYENPDDSLLARSYFTTTFTVSGALDVYLSWLKDPKGVSLEQLSDDIGKLIAEGVIRFSDELQSDA